MNTSLTVVYWRDIPAQVVARTGGGRRRAAAARRALSGRFQEAIDRAAMRAGLAGSDAYLAEWRRGEPVPAGGDAQAEADAFACRLEAEFTDEVLAALVASGGRAGSGPAAHEARAGTTGIPEPPPSGERGAPAREDRGGTSAVRGLEARAPGKPCA